MRERNACRTFETDLAAVVLMDLELGGVFELLDSKLEAVRRRNPHVLAVDAADGDHASDVCVCGGGHWKS